MHGWLGLTANVRPGERASQVVPDADIVLCTGITVVSDTPENLLAQCHLDARVVMVGATVDLYSDAFLRRGVEVLGGVTTPDAFLDVLHAKGNN